MAAEDNRRRKNFKKYIDNKKVNLDVRARLYTNKSICPYNKGLWGKIKVLRQNKVISSFFTINNVIRNKKSEHDKPMTIVHNDDL